ncbi:MAG: DNA gyrase subunit A [Planctomycetes bacterium]|nr:DNA gyrase subunit A [Planctomycetota bacterium]
MAKKPEEAPAAPLNPKNVELLNIADEMRESYLTYAMSVIVARALPDVRDGLKPSQRRVLVAMNDLNLGPTGKFRKCAKIAGDTSGNYHPHGEAVVYPTLVRMAQSFNTRYLLVDPQGNFGTIDGDPPAAMRYTEARLTRASVDMMEDLEKDTVDYIDNYDGTRQEPSVFPGKFPNLLCNGTGGIAVGMATSMPPHNVNEVCDGIVAIIDDPELPIESLMKIIKGPDFPTGGVIHGRKGINDAYKTGRGIVTVRGRAEIEEAANGRSQILITEIPYQVNKTTMIEKIAELVKTDAISGVSDIKDYSKEDIKLVIEIKRDADPNIVLNQIYKHTQLQSSFSIINIAIVEGKPQTLNLKQLCEAYRDHRKNVILRRTRWLLNKAKARHHIVSGLLGALDLIDAIIKLIRAAKDVDEAREKLMAMKVKFPPAPKGLELESGTSFTRLQADAILAMTLSKLTGLERTKLQEEFDALLKEIEDLMDILAKDSRVFKMIKDDLADIKKRHGDERRTAIKGEIGEFDITDLIPDEQVVVTISFEGYIKRVPLLDYRKQNRGGTGSVGAKSKEGDFIEHFFLASTHDYLLVFTTLGKLFWLKVYDIPEFGKTAKGRALVNLLSMSNVEKVSACIRVREFKEDRFLMFATSQGTVKRTSLDAYSNVRNAGIKAIKLNEGDRLIDVMETGGADEIVLASRKGMAIRFPEAEVRPMGRDAAGVNGMNLEDKDEVVSMAVVNRKASLITVCEKGFGKRTAFDEYRIQHRAGVGLINVRVSDKNGEVVAAKSIFSGDEIMVMTRLGVVLRTTVTEESMREIGRATMGVRLMRVADDDSIVSVVKIMNEEEEVAKAEGEAPPPEPTKPGQPIKEVEVKLSTAQALEKAKKEADEALKRVQDAMKEGPPSSKRAKKVDDEDEKKKK